MNVWRYQEQDRMCARNQDSEGNLLPTIQPSQGPAASVGEPNKLLPRRKKSSLIYNGSRSLSEHVH